MNDMQFLLFRWNMWDAAGGLNDLQHQGEDLVAMIAADDQLRHNHWFGSNQRADIWMLQDGCLTRIAEWDNTNERWREPWLAESDAQTDQDLSTFDPVQWLAEHRPKPAQEEM